MPGKQAKILSKNNIQGLLVYASRSRYPRRNRVLVMLSIKAGLRAGEIAKLTARLSRDRSRWLRLTSFRMEIARFPTL
jgi:hypothetical protein